MSHKRVAAARTLSFVYYHVGGYVEMCAAGEAKSTTNFFNLLSNPKKHLQSLKCGV